jgi:hypothetical protein
MGFLIGLELNILNDILILLLKGSLMKASKRSYIQGIWWYDLVDDGNQISNSEHNYGILTQDMKQKEISQLFLK